MSAKKEDRQGSAPIKQYHRLSFGAWYRTLHGRTQQLSTVAPKNAALRLHFWRPTSSPTLYRKRTPPVGVVFFFGARYRTRTCVLVAPDRFPAPVRGSENRGAALRRRKTCHRHVFLCARPHAVKQCLPCRDHRSRLLPYIKKEHRPLGWCSFLVRGTGLEPVTPCTSSMCSTS